MHRQRHAQREHIILSLDALLYQLHTLSFILSPLTWSFLCRLASQFTCSKPRDLDATASRSLRFFFTNILLFNASSVWYHATQGAIEGRAVVLDFVGLAYVPSRLQLLGLDVLIIFLQLVLTTIAYETSFIEHNAEPDTHDVLLPIPDLPFQSPTLSPLSVSPPSTPVPTAMSHSKFHSLDSASPYIIDLRLAPIIARLRNAPPPSRNPSDASLPLPNTTPWHLPPSMRSLIRASSQVGRENGVRGSSNGSSRIPGGLAT